MTMYKYFTTSQTNGTRTIILPSVQSRTYRKDT